MRRPELPCLSRPPWKGCHDRHPSEFPFPELACLPDPRSPRGLPSLGVRQHPGRNVPRLAESAIQSRLSRGAIRALSALAPARRLGGRRAAPSWLGLPLLAAGLGLHLYGAYYYYIWIDAVAFLPTLAGLWLTCGGKTGWRWGWPSILFLFFMIPLPYRTAIALSGPLQRLATVLSTFIMQCLGMPALSEGNIITLNEHAIDVVEACSGLRMLVVFFALSTAVVLLFQRHWLDKLILILGAVPIALVSNITRIIVTGVLYDLFNDSATITYWVHESADWLMMPLGLGLLWVELQLLNHLFIALPPTPPRVSRTTPPRRTPPAPLVRQRQTAAAGKREAARPSTQRRERQAPPAALQEAQPAPTPTTVQPSVGTEEVKR